MKTSYWDTLLQSRISRRRAIVATGAAAGSAAFLAACGGDNKGDGGGKEKSTLAIKTEDTIKEAKRGGIIKDRTNADASSMDVQQPIAPLNYPARHVYSTLVRVKAPYLQAPTTFDLSPDLAESWEVAPDGLSITMKLRANAKWHNRPPVNGRTADASDVVFSWNRYAASAPLRALVANAVNPQAPVLSLTATDPKTISIKLKEPLVYALELFASFGSFTGNVVIMPKEIESGFDPRRDMIGTGPYMLTEYQPSIGFTLKRNPDYWDQNANFADQINLPIVIEYAQFVAQIKAGNIYHSFDQLRAEDLFTIKSDEPRLQIYALDLQTASSVMTFGQLPDGKSPFTDERVRQAFSMAWDRDALIDAMFSVPGLEAGGVAVESRWNSALPADFGNAGWLDPQGKDFGPNAKYYQYNVDEAKKLLAAAGLPQRPGREVQPDHDRRDCRHGPATQKPPRRMVRDAGFRITVVDIDYATQYIPRCATPTGSTRASASTP